MSVSKTIIISCAGMGTRLGLNTNKALIDIDGEPLIIRQLKVMDDFEDIRIVVGYQADKVIEVVRTYRSDITFVFNHEYKTTRTAASLCLGKKHANDMIVSLDGDIIFHPEDFKKFVCEDEEEAIGVCMPYTNEPVYVNTKYKNEEEYAVNFSRDTGKYEWTGLFKIYRKNLGEGQDHVYKLITPNLPLKAIAVRCKEIDNYAEYENALRWFKNGYKEV